MISNINRNFDEKEESIKIDVNLDIKKNGTKSAPLFEDPVDLDIFENSESSKYHKEISTSIIRKNYRYHENWIPKDLNQTRILSL